MLALGHVFCVPCKVSAMDLVGIRTLKMVHLSWWVPGHTSQELCQESWLSCSAESQGWSSAVLSHSLYSRWQVKVCKNWFFTFFWEPVSAELTSVTPWWWMWPTVTIGRTQLQEEYERREGRRGQACTGESKLLVMVWSQLSGGRTAQVLWWHQVVRLTARTAGVCLTSMGHSLCSGLDSCASPLEYRAVRSVLAFNSSKLHFVGIFCFFCAGKANGFQLRRSSAPYTLLCLVSYLIWGKIPTQP